MILRTIALFTGTALAELAGCYLSYLWLRKDGSSWLLLPAAASLAAFAWLLTLHPGASGRVYAAYGGVYVAMAILWLWLIDGQRPTRWDLLGAAITLTGMAIIMFAPRAAGSTKAERSGAAGDSRPDVHVTPPLPAPSARPAGDGTETSGGA